MSLSCLVFVTNNTRSDRSRQFSIIFGINQTYLISHIVIMSGFHHRLQPIWLVTIAQFHFRYKLHLYNRSQHLNFVFGIEHIYMINHVVVLSGFRHSQHPVRLVMIVYFVFRIGCSCTIDHVVVLSGFCHRLHRIRLITIGQFRFRRRPYLYDQSSCCPVWFSS